MYSNVVFKSNIMRIRFKKFLDNIFLKKSAIYIFSMEYLDTRLTNDKRCIFKHYIYVI